MEGCVGFWRTAHRIAKESDSLVDFIFGKKVLVALNKLSLLTSRVGSHRVSFALKTLVSVDFLLDIDFLDVFFFFIGKLAIICLETNYWYDKNHCFFLIRVARQICPRGKKDTTMELTRIKTNFT
jgi:hypothetical protein